MQEDKAQNWLNEFYAEAERLFDGILPKTFNINYIPYCENIHPKKAATQYFVAIHKI